MGTWSAKDKAAIEATELILANLGASANLVQIANEDYTGPLFKIFVSAWRWIRRKLGYSH
ncbi:MAG TPA: hypothetical protein VND66_03870 [Acidobacteriaceae bacterium]|nr:hypothetical protein [Acidobacteriaceae bacterium]